MGQFSKNVRKEVLAWVFGNVQKRDMEYKGESVVL